MALMKREEWFDLARHLDWTPGYVPRDELFPPEASGGRDVAPAEWERWDEPYKISFREYVHTQRTKETSVYAVKAALERVNFIERADPRWKTVLKAHFGAICLGEYGAGLGEARMARYAPSAAWRNVAVLGLLDEVRHTQLELLYPHGWVDESPQWDWAHKALHTNEWGAIAARSVIDDLMLASSALDTAVGLTFVFETGFTNVQFLGLAMDALDEGDIEFSTLLASVQTDEARHSQQGSAVLDILVKKDKAHAQYVVDKSFWRTWRLFALLTGTAMDYYIPLEHRHTSFKEFVDEWVCEQFIRSIDDHGLDLPWYWDIFQGELNYLHHALHLGVWFWRPTMWFDPAGGVSPAEREWLVSKYPDWEECFGSQWDEITRNLREGREEQTLPLNLPLLCNVCHLPVSARSVWLNFPDKGEWTVLSHDVDGRRYHFCSEPCQWIFHSEQSRYGGGLTLVDRFLAGMIDPPDLGGALAYMGIGPGEAGKDALGYAWALGDESEGRDR